MSPLTNILHNQHGYKCVPVSLRSIGCTPGAKHKGVEEDTQEVRNTILSELSANPDVDVVVVAHSYGGIPAMNSLQDLDRSPRAAAGHKNAVSAAAIICGFVLRRGETLTDAVRHHPPENPIFDISEDGYAVTCDPMRHFYHELPQAEAKHWCSLLQPQPLVAYGGAVSWEGYKLVPTSYLLATEYRAVPIESQRDMVECVKPAVLRTEEIACGHSPYLSVPERVAEFVRRSAGEEI